MIYRGHSIQAIVEKWDIYDVNDDGTLGGYAGEGGGDTDYPFFEVWTLDEDGDNENCIAEGLESFEAAKLEVDSIITRATTFQSEEGN